MVLTPDHPKAATTIVVLNDKPIRHYISASDDEGWIEVLDIMAMAPLTDNRKITVDELIEFSPVKTKLIRGKVEFKSLKVSSTEEND